VLDLFPSPAAGKFGRRLRRERGARIPVTVVTGFLGAGKTTLVRRFLASPEGAGTAVIVNEFGAVGIDDALVRSASDETVLLGNGCLCCTARTDLQVALRRLVADRERGKIPQFTRIVIETSGLADPSPILQTFATDQALGGEFYLEVVVAVVDAAAGDRTLEWSAEARKQVILADRLVLTKTDLVAKEAADALVARLRAMNPRAPVDIAVDGALDPSRLIEPVDAERTGLVAEAAHSDGIVSFVMREDRPLSWQTFVRAMETLIALRGPDLLRVKGLLNVQGCGGPVVVQFVQHLAHPPVELAVWPNEDHTSRLVFITRNLAEAQVRDLFAAVRALAFGVND
jgi:G3E family GTPase